MWLAEDLTGCMSLSFLCVTAQCSVRHCCDICVKEAAPLIACMCIHQTDSLPVNSKSLVDYSFVMCSCILVSLCCHRLSLRSAVTTHLLKMIHEHMGPPTRAKHFQTEYANGIQPHMDNSPNPDTIHRLLSTQIASSYTSPKSHWTSMASVLVSRLYWSSCVLSCHPEIYP